MLQTRQKGLTPARKRLELWMELQTGQIDLRKALHCSGLARRLMPQRRTDSTQVQPLLLRACFAPQNSYHRVKTYFLTLL